MYLIAAVLAVLVLLALRRSRRFGSLKTGPLLPAFTGAALMWSVDLAFSLARGEEFFTADPAGVSLSALIALSVPLRCVLAARRPA